MKKISFLFCAVMLFTLTVVNGQDAAVKGSPYLDEAFVDGEIHYASKVHKVPVRYNAYQDVIEFKQAGQNLVLDASDAIKKIHFGSTTMIPLKYAADGKSKFGYFEVLDSGKVTLLSKKKITFLKAKKGGALDGSDQAAEYKRGLDTFYYKNGDGAIQEIESIKSMIASLSDKQEELTLFAKKEKISPRKEKEIIQFVKYYNSLAEEEE